MNNIAYQKQRKNIESAGTRSWSKQTGKRWNQDLNQATYCITRCTYYWVWLIVIIYQQMTSCQMIEQQGAIPLQYLVDI